MSRQSLGSDPVALVTGGAHRIGAAVVRELHAAGMRVAIHHHRSRSAAIALCAELNARRPDSAMTVNADLACADALGPLVKSVVGRFQRLDGLVNCAAVFDATPIGEICPARLRAMLAVNLEAPWLLSQAALAHLRASGGSIVNITDIYAERALSQYSIYCASKSGLAMATRALARELGPRVRVNAVAPGPILWPEPEPPESVKSRILAETPLGRTGSPSDVAGAVRFLLCDAGYVTGQVLNVDGGRSL